MRKRRFVFFFLVSMFAVVAIRHAHHAHRVRGAIGRHVGIRVALRHDDKGGPGRRSPWDWHGRDLERNDLENDDVTDRYDSSNHDDDRDSPAAPHRGRLGLASIDRSNPVAPREVVGLRSADEGRALASLRVEVQKVIAKWLEPDVPNGWTPSDELVETTFVAGTVRPIERDYATVYEAAEILDLSPQNRAGFVREYNRELVQRRILIMGGSLAFSLICLGTIAGYIRADEATRGYYTNRLRFAAFGSVAAAATGLYYLLA
ncbi:MAG: hypothetical protein KGM43_17540 [Planctomycetota bacterium]|nr:hypothetical protein [Planctomycetota bacterium]